MIRLRNILFIFCLVILQYKSFAQHYNFRQYNVEDGLAHSQVSAILQDHNGYMWFSTYGGGISRFDGKNFKTFTEKDGLPNNITRPIIEDKKNNLWIGTMGSGICRYDGKKFTSLKDSAVQINKTIYTIIQSADDKIWFGADNGVYYYDGKHVRHFTQKDGLPEVPVMNIFQDSKGFIWVASWENGVYILKDEKVVNHFTDKDGLSYHTQMSADEDSKGNIWLSSFKGVTKVVKRPDGSFNFYRSFGNLIDSNLIYSVVDDKKGNLWFSTTQNGLIKYNAAANTYTKISNANGLPGNVVVALVPDREGNLWLSDWGMGAVEFLGERFIHYTAKDGLGNDIANSITTDNSGNIVVNSGKGIFKFSKENKLESISKEIETLGIYTAAYDDKDVLWIGTKDALYSYDGKKLKKYTSADGITALPITILTCENGNVWIGSWSGKLNCFDGKTVQSYSTKNGLSSDYIYTVYKAKNGKIYVGTWDGGLCVKDKTGFKIYKKEQGLPSNNVISITEDNAGTIWLGTFGGGICKFNSSPEKGKKEFEIISSKDGLSDDAVVAMVFDNDQNLFIAGSKGLNRLNVNEYNRSGKIKISYYGKEDGFAGIECTHNSAVKDKDGNLWFGTKKGLTRYNSTYDKKNELSPEIYITDLKLFFEKTDWSKLCDSVNPLTGLPFKPLFNYKTNHLTFNFIGICTSNPDKVRYRYMLEGVDKDWSPPTDKTDVTYSGIAPGDYLFKVIACNNDGVYNETPATFIFTIEPPFWQRKWFYILCIIVLICASYFYTKWQTKKLEKENKILEGKVEERTTEVRRQKSELQVAYNEIEEKNEIVEQKNRDITDSINYAKRIQKAILPLDSEIIKSLPGSFVLFKPRDIVSGDFYWYCDLSRMENGERRIENDEKEEKSKYRNLAENEGGSELPTKFTRLIFACVDCTGHGVPGAFMSMIGNSLLNEIVYEKKIHEPAKILDQLNEGVRLSLKQNQQDNETHDGMDIALVSINGMELNYAGAHRPLLIIRNGKLEEIAADKFPIGGMPSEEKRSFTNNKISLSKGDTFYMFTDGFVDQFGGEKGKKFMTKRFQELLLSIQDKTMDEQKTILNTTIENWKGNVEQVDDILVIGIRI